MRSAWHSNAILLSANTWVVWGWCDDVDGEHWRTSVCVNNLQSFCHQLLKKRWRRGKAWVRWANQRRYTQNAQHKYQNGLIFLILPRKYLRKNWWWNRCGDNDQIANRDLKLKFISIRKVKTEEKRVKHTHRFKDRIFVIQQRWNDWDKLEQRWSKTQQRQLEEGLQAARWRRSARTGWERWRGIAHRRGGSIRKIHLLNSNMQF